jgi:hypothetical protein
LLTFSRSFNCERVKEEGWQEISRYQLFAPSEMALATMPVEFARLMLLSGQPAQ